MEKENDEGILGEYIVVMDDYGGGELKSKGDSISDHDDQHWIFEKASNVYLVHRHTKLHVIGVSCC